MITLVAPLAAVVVTVASSGPPLWTQRELCAGLWDQARRGDRFLDQLKGCLATEERSQLYVNWYWKQIAEPVQELCLSQTREKSYFKLARCFAIQVIDPAISKAAPGPTGD